MHSHLICMFTSLRINQFLADSAFILYAVWYSWGLLKRILYFFYSHYETHIYYLITQKTAWNLYLTFNVLSVLLIYHFILLIERLKCIIGRY